ncbi:hypothetical protein H103_01806 [Trichophyton rubrum CBS 288.86]|uniref:Uncharacterized protein n=2 Tax=Trichophyton rubrum TaxID=5551 RepID=A0A080WL39_TRIRC|nr:uncharacterized protein TERG_12431 [Trichophyton rubrum CBS 118892]EZF26000.1 hypothetical protein H100_01802 [Trichophyton rubrum MR850]EZF55648.1 hypothetical protein H103_01806 [Trichophyton rubrum CBS 288.86]EZF66313.1 hypothetical protein H104_01784 [Trichophyton rubrum CBS 289.86]EZF87630.1 hypothetical protein H110_01807 [Trichophyton rubrum MR1448]EZG09480.1 hypothetical protein H106_01657 [Trichophyton rubrum CBS 735.88]EZG19920.1 hypothetical protein H107_01866 [Trichophyton rubr
MERSRQQYLTESFSCSQVVVEIPDVPILSINVWPSHPFVQSSSYIHGIQRIETRGKRTSCCQGPVELAEPFLLSYDPQLARCQAKFVTTISGRDRLLPDSVC